MRVETRRQPLPPRERLEAIFHVEKLDATYGSKAALKGVSMEIYKNLVTAIIGPSGCGKSTYIRCFNRMNDLIPSFRMTG
ncbi:MAG: ATP-binding cassette domain-containing protein, partial [Acidobacteriota bacterium]|nr:ATP-binding cassette domain-containing protein [Acidobacteriota bacterium]